MIFQKVLKKIPNLNVLDRSILKICLVSFGLLLAALIPELAQLDRWIYAIIFVATDVYVLLRLFRK
ncbi:hypothetical protein K9M48_01955 [Candidatus Gracilibacteria bacterium]|nr:hypothetical protein [Candidatus Gracilibacteria bacterium]